jgi:hypothetical protein
MSYILSFKVQIWEQSGVNRVLSMFQYSWKTFFVRGRDTLKMNKQSCRGEYSIYWVSLFNQATANADSFFKSKYALA